MNRLLTSCVVLLSLSLTLSAGGAWARKYGPLEVSSTGAVAAMPKGGAVVMSGGFKRLLFNVDAKGNVLEAREFPQQWMFLAARDSIIAATMKSDTPVDIRVAKLDVRFSTQWANRYVPPQDLSVRALIATRDGGTALVGRIGPAGFIMRIAADGRLQWAKTVDASGNDDFHALVETRDGGIVAAGAMNHYDPWLVKLAKDGALAWQVSYRPARRALRAVTELPDGDLVVSGEFPLVMRTSSTGQPKWQKGIASDATTQPRSIQARSITSLGGGAVAISAEGPDRLSRAIVAINGDATVRWQRRFTPSGPIPSGGSFASADLTITANGALLYGPQLQTSDGSGSTMLFELDAKDGSGCAWFSPGALELRDTAARAEVLPVEVQPLPFETSKWNVESSNIALSASGEPCAAAVAPAASQEPPAAASQSRGASFNSDRDQREKARAWYELVKTKQFAKLDDIAAALRAKPIGVDPMHWDLGTFYGAITTTEFDSEEVVLQRLREWRAARPDSVTAGVALASALHDAAWKRRGRGYADTITAEGGRQYAALLEESEKTFATVRGAEHDSQYWSQQVHYAMESGGDVREVARRAAKYTHDPRIFHGAANGLLPKWGGSIAEYVAFADEAARLTRATYGDALYMWIAYQARFAMNDEDFASAEFDWKRVQQGARDLIKLAPEWLPSYHRLALLARRFNDRAVAREMFQRQELEYYEDAIKMWRTREAYDTARDWALRPVAAVAPAPATKLKTPSAPAAPSPLVSRAPSDWPQVVMQNAVTIAGKKHERIASFLVETPQGIVAVSSVPSDREVLGQSNLLEHTQRRLAGWTMASPKKRSAALTVASFETKNAPMTQHGVALALEPVEGELPVHVLTRNPQRGAPKLGERVFIVGCRWAGGVCTQVVLEGALTSRSGGNRLVHHFIGLKEAHDPATLAGAAVLDEDGYVFAVLNEQSGGSAFGYQTILDGEDLSTVITP